MKLGLIGCGNVGKEISNFVAKHNNIEKLYVYDIDPEKIKILESINNKNNNNENKKIIPCSTISELFSNSNLIIEAAHPSAVNDVLVNSIEHKKDIIILSSGGLIGQEDRLSKMRDNGIRIYIPSGAIAGIDAISSIADEKIKKLTITTTKPAKSLEGAPYITKKKINLFGLKKKTTIFQGSIKKAIEGFPANINVCATLYFFSKFDKIQVKIIADPNAIKNIHEVVVEGNFGKITTITENVPSKNNPKTSYLAIVSVIALLKNLVENY